MESSPQDSASDAGMSGSEPATPLTEAPASAETAAGGEHLTPARRPGHSGSSKVVSSGFHLDQRSSSCMKGSEEAAAAIFPSVSGTVSEQLVIDEEVPPVVSSSGSV
ncbi:hypothetical protein Q5P01_006980 [Channa striata]|uniref:Uncharacterized protein n=1 Tax=Channa striata TaxID=64152 RepID=A0AA88NF68_CHASR|nr:hypothetical protein Q5P01_006980 [Channa striata]